MKEALTTNQVVIVLVEHPVLGLLLVPYTVGRALDNTLEVIEQAFHASPDALKKMNEAEQKAIDIASHYTEKYLMGVYSREKHEKPVRSLPTYCPRPGRRCTVRAIVPKQGALRVQ